MHQFGHVLSARYDMTHGASLSITMPAYMRHLSRHRLDRYVQFAGRVLGMRTRGRKADPRDVLPATWM